MFFLILNFSGAEVALEKSNPPLGEICWSSINLF